MNEQILIVDDEAAVRETLGDWLEASGYRCIVAASAEEALQRTDGVRVDAALLDLAMPGHDGLWLARRLRERDRDLALVLCTGWQSFEAAVEGMRIGISDYLLKPFSQAELLGVIESALDARRERCRPTTSPSEPLVERVARIARAFGAVPALGLGTLEAVLTTLAGSNAEAVQHARRVAGYASAIGDAMRLAPAETAVLHAAALLHDVGKLALPEALLLKADALSTAEIRQIRMHPQLAYEALSAAEGLGEVAEVVWASHEAWDGSGYPRGLEGAEIPLASRIIAVADTFDALTWARFGRVALTPHRAASELTASAGGQFDPVVVQSALRALNPAATVTVH